MCEQIAITDGDMSSIKAVRLIPGFHPFLRIGLGHPDCSRWDENLHAKRSESVMDLYCIILLHGLLISAWFDNTHKICSA